MTANDEQYVPTEGQVREQYVGDHRAAYAPEFAAEFDRFLARVKRDAWEEGYDAAAEFYGIDTCLAADNPYEETP